MGVQEGSERMEGAEEDDGGSESGSDGEEGSEAETEMGDSINSSSKASSARTNRSGVDRASSVGTIDEIDEHFAESILSHSDPPHLA